MRDSAEQFPGQRRDPMSSRQMTHPRRTELFIVISMRNEDDSLFTRIMPGVMKNIAYSCKHDRSKA